ncbi:MAG TPA: diguanylate cyclase [Candidatus Acidoferrum sp.]|nr:diguanylate cyclase [Candidatus Acidoferrum sp.]
MADVTKHLDRAKKFLEKNRVEDAIEAYLSVLEEAPSHMEATQALGDLYARREQPDRAAIYYGMFFDLLVDPKDETKALAIYNRFLKHSSAQQQPPERIARYAFLQQKQNRTDEASEQYAKAADLFTAAGREEDALFCLERIAQIEPDNLGRQVKLADVAEKNGRNMLAARALLRAGQLSSASGSAEDSLGFLARAHRLAPQERSVALLYAAARLRKGDAAEAVKLLDPFSGSETDPVFLETFADALMRSGQLDRARVLLEKLLQEKNAGLGRLFQLADLYAAAGAGSKAVEILGFLKKRMFAQKRQNEFAAQLDDVAGRHGESAELLEFWANLYNELNRESKYFEIMIRLFDAYIARSEIKKACDSLERLVDIDAYDYRNQERLERLKGKADDAFLRRVASRLTKSGTSTSTADTIPPAGPTSSREQSAPVTEEGQRMQALEDLIVQTEIFLQYSLQTKALDRLQKIAELFPGEEEKNERLRKLYQSANWWPKGGPPKKEPARAAGSTSDAAVVAASKTGAFSADTLRDLSKISEVNQKIFRQQTPRAMLNTAVSEVGEYLHVSRALAVIGATGRPPDLAAEFCGANMKPAPGAQVVFLLAQAEKTNPDELGGLIVENAGTALSDLGLRTALGVKITDRETQQVAGMLIVGQSEPRKWKPNETYFLQAIGDQMLMSVSHTRLRSLVRRMGVSDERSGLLSRSSYQSCLLTEADRARTQGTPLSLTIVQIDRGAEIARQQGESPMERFLEQLARSLQPIVRQNDVAVKYSSWSLAFILPDTALAGAQNLADKLRRAASGIRPPWDSTSITLSAGIVEAVAKPDFESEDIVTDLMNRAEFSVEEARKRGGDTVVTLEAPKL